MSHAKGEKLGYKKKILYNLPNDPYSAKSTAVEGCLTGAPIMKHNKHAGLWSTFNSLSIIGLIWTRLMDWFK